MDPQIAKFVVNDLAAATYVPYNEDGSIAPGLVEGHCADLARHKVPFAFINGTTGDSMALSVEERKTLAEAWIAAGNKHGVVIINHVGACSITECMELAKHSQDIGCKAIAAMPPVFFKPANAKEVAQWLQRIGAAAPSLPLYYYHFPVITGVTVDPYHLLLAIEAVGVPTFRGMKFTEFNLYHYSNCVRHGNGRYDMAYGRDEAMLGGLATGATASIGNGFNFAPGVFQRLRAAFFKGDLATARVEQGRSAEIVNIMQDARFGGNGLTVSRQFYEWCHNVKLGPPRLPHQPLTEEQKTALRKELEKIGFFEWCD